VSLPATVLAYLLADDRPERQLVAVDVPGRSQSWHRDDRRSEHCVGAERLGDRDRIGVEIEQPSQPADRGREIAEIVEADEASQVPLDAGLDGDLGDAGPVWQGKCPAIALPVAFLDPWDRPCGEEPEELRGSKRGSVRELEGDRPRCGPRCRVG
jgi:hypothetical protein